MSLLQANVNFVEAFWGVLGLAFAVVAAWALSSPRKPAPDKNSETPELRQAKFQFQVSIISIFLSILLVAFSLWVIFAV